MRHSQEHVDWKTTLVLFVKTYCFSFFSKLLKEHKRDPKRLDVIHKFSRHSNIWYHYVPLIIVWPLLSRWMVLLLGRLVVFCSKYQHQNQLRYAFWCILLSLLPFLASQATTRILWFICMKCEDRQSIT